MKPKPPRNRRGLVTRESLAFIVTHLRPRDREEIFALRWDDNEETFIDEMMALCGAMTWIWERDGVPVSVQGAVCSRPHVWEVFAFGTACWPRVVLDMTRHVKRFMIPALLRVGAHRVECRALLSHTDSRKWLTALGAKEAAILQRFGRNAETYVSYVWGPSDVSS